MVYLRASINMAYHYSLMTLCLTLHYLYHALNVGTIDILILKISKLYQIYYNFFKKKKLTEQ